MQIERKTEFETKFMKSTTKNKVLELFLKNLVEKHGLEEKLAWRIASELSVISNSVVQESTEGISKAYNESTVLLEQHRKQFRDHIEFLEKRTKTILGNFKQQGFFTIGKDKKTGKPILVGRTSMVNDMVDFLNDMNQSVQDFYINVYKINEENAHENGILQISLFN